MNRTTLAQLREQHGRFPRVIRNLVDGVDPALLRAREGENRWSPLEILAHLLDEEREDFRPRAQAAAAGRPIERGIAPEKWAIERSYNDMDPEHVLGDFESERARSCRWLADLDVERLEAALEHPELGRMRCGDFVAAWRMHDLLHLRQLSTALAVLTARSLPGWRLDYAGRIPEPAPKSGS
jgi:hypothetical protein